MKGNTTTRIDDIEGSCVGCYSFREVNGVYYCRKNPLIKTQLFVTFTYNIIKDPKATPSWCKRWE